MPRRRFKTVLVLSGGSARALAHLGILQKIQEHKIRVDMIVGTSMGAIIGALYSHYGDVFPVIEKMRKLVHDEVFLRAVSMAAEDIPEAARYSSLDRFIWLFRRGVYYTHSMIRPSLVPEETYAEIMGDLIPDRNIEDLQIPFAAVTMDLLNGEEVVLTKGPLRAAVSASSAIPGILPPAELHGRALVDGGWVDNVPVAPAIAMGASFVIASDTCLDILSLGPLPSSAIESLFRCNEITRISLNHHRSFHADVLLVPHVGFLYWADFSALERCLTVGQAVLEGNLRTIRRKRRLRQLVSLRGWVHPARRCSQFHPLVMY